MMELVRRVSLALALALALVAVACRTSADPGGGPSPAAAGGLQAIVASPDLHAGATQRFAVGLPFAAGGDVRTLSFGTVELAFTYLGPVDEPRSPEPGLNAVARYVPTPGTPAEGAGPRPTAASEARGVYEAGGVTFAEAGIWQVEVLADVQGEGAQRATAAFEVLETPALPAPGDEALPTRNLTVDSKGVPEAAIDSRAATEGRVPDPELHRWTISRALDEGVPAVVVFATPVYCVSLFCGPVTEAVESLAARFDDRAVFIHVEIWKDFNAQPQVVNEAAADWLYRNDNLTEPWVYLIGADGIIDDRWAGVFDPLELEAALRELPPLR